jgi:diguanylate cyclase (GGDEF)-like protein
MGHAELIADRSVTILRTEIDLAGHRCRVTASVGVTLCGPGHRAATDLLLGADEAMYAAKAAGKNRYIVAEAVRTSS